MFKLNDSVAVFFSGVSDFTAAPPARVQSVGVVIDISPDGRTIRVSGSNHLFVKLYGYDAWCSSGGVLIPAENPLAQLDAALTADAA